jgi:hypothetical protein
MFYVIKTTFKSSKKIYIIPFVKVGPFKIYYEILTLISPQRMSIVHPVLILRATFDLFGRTFDQLATPGVWEWYTALADFLQDIHCQVIKKIWHLLNTYSDKWTTKKEIRSNLRIHGKISLEQNSFENSQMPVKFGSFIWLHMYGNRIGPKDIHTRTSC